jgi:hypothetical protein
MSFYLQILLLLVAFIVFVVIVLYVGGLGVWRMCFKIIAEMEETKAFIAAKAIKFQEQRKNIFCLGTGALPVSLPGTQSERSYTISNGVMLIKILNPKLLICR